jgi:glutamyl-tRNA reductase
MAGQYGVSPLPFEQLSGALAEADVVFTSAAAPIPIIRREIISQVMAKRPERPLALIDLAVPRNVETKARDLPGVHVYDMDDLQTFAKDAIQGSHEDIARAERMVEEEVAEYEKLLRIIPFLGELHKKIETIRQREVEKTLRRLPNLDAEVSAQIELLSRSLVQKVLHEPTMRLRTGSDQESLNDYVDALAKLFDLSEGIGEKGIGEI